MTSIVMCCCEHQHRNIEDFDETNATFNSTDDNQLVYDGVTTVCIIYGHVDVYHQNNLSLSWKHSFYTHHDSATCFFQSIIQI